MPDPCCGEGRAVEHVPDRIEHACEGLLANLGHYRQVLLPRQEPPIDSAGVLACRGSQAP